MWQVNKGKKETFVIIESETGEMLHSIGAGLWTHTDRATAERVAKEANDLRYVAPASRPKKSAYWIKVTKANGANHHCEIWAYSEKEALQAAAPKIQRKLGTKAKIVDRRDPS